MLCIQHVFYSHRNICIKIPSSGMASRTDVYVIFPGYRDFFFFQDGVHCSEIVVRSFKKTAYHLFPFTSIAHLVSSFPLQTNNDKK